MADITDIDELTYEDDGERRYDLYRATTYRVSPLHPVLALLVELERERGAGDHELTCELLSFVANEVATDEFREDTILQSFYAEGSDDD